MRFFLSIFIATLIWLCTSTSQASYKYTDQFYRDLHVLTECIYHEARGEDNMGKLAVGLVVLTRVKSNKFPDTFEGVIYEERVDNIFQFSYNTKKDKTMKNVKAKLICRTIAEFILDNMDNPVMIDLIDGADHYHATYINKPYWTKSMKYVKRVGKHMFYKS